MADKSRRNADIWTVNSTQPIPDDQIPDSLRSILSSEQDVRYTSGLMMNIEPRVYFLCAYGEVVYVGAALRSPLERAMFHYFDGKYFDSMFSIPSSVEEVFSKERRCINALRPYYNDSGAYKAEWRYRWPDLSKELDAYAKHRMNELPNYGSRGSRGVPYSMRETDAKHRIKFPLDITNEQRRALTVLRRQATLSRNNARTWLADTLAGSLYVDIAPIAAETLQEYDARKLAEVTQRALDKLGRIDLLAVVVNRTENELRARIAMHSRETEFYAESRALIDCLLLQGQSVRAARGATMGESNQ